MLDPWFKNEYPLKHAKKWLYWAWAEYRVLRDAKAVIFTTEEERVLARTSFWLYNVKEAVVNYGTADPGPVTDSAKAAFSTKFPQLNGKRLLLYLGRIHRKKGCDLLIRAFADIIRSDDDSFRLVMAGPDATNWRPELVALSKKLGIADRISWPGPLEGELKWGAFGAAEAFVLCSHQENFGIAVAEALGCGSGGKSLREKPASSLRTLSTERDSYFCGGLTHPTLIDQECVETHELLSWNISK
jgi:glycosyltransferase involved in cell wall biosynthesis